MSDKQPALKRGRGRPSKLKQVNTPIESHIKISEHINNINNYKIDNPDDIQSIIQHIDDSELAIVIDASFASNIAMQINTPGIINNDIDNENEMSIILETIREREEQEKNDEEFARKLSEEFNNNGNINSSEINNGASGIDYDDFDNGASGIDYGASGTDNNISFINKFNEDRNIRNIQDEEYEESLRFDEEKEKEKGKEKGKQKGKEKDIDKINVNHKIYTDSINLKDETDSNSIEKEIKKLSIKEMRDARLAFFNKK